MVALSRTGLAALPTPICHLSRRPISPRIARADPERSVWAMILSEHQRRSINGTAALKAKMARSGLTPAGQPIWSEVEIAALRSAWPDKILARRRLPARTMKAIEHKAARLGLTRKRTVWSPTDVNGLRPQISYR